MIEILRRIRVRLVGIEVHSLASLENKKSALKDLDSLIKDSEKGRFYCNWCGEMKPIEERREITDETEYVTWVGCVDCHKGKMRLIQHAPK